MPEGLHYRLGFDLQTKLSSYIEFLPGLSQFSLSRMGSAAVKYNTVRNLYGSYFIFATCTKKKKATVTGK